MENSLRIRVESDLKNKLEEKATQLGLSLSAYVRLTLIQSLK